MCAGLRLSLLRRVEEHPYDDHYQCKDDDDAEHRVERAADDAYRAAYQLCSQYEHADRNCQRNDDADDLILVNSVSPFLSIAPSLSSTEVKYSGSSDSKRSSSPVTGWIRCSLRAWRH